MSAGSAPADAAAPPATAAVPARILALLGAHGVTPRVHVHAPVISVEQAQRLAPHLVEHLIKTIAFAIEPGTRIVLAAVPHAAQVDYRRLAAVAGCNRRALRLLPAEQVERELGFEVGGLGPFAIEPHIEVVVDDSVLAQGWLRCGGGLRTQTLELASNDVVRASAARVAPIAKAPS